ncbi:MAG: universal stress protein [Pelagimonas sp.]|jgi:nucleotide-binding universal stress UspA family protein|nr:universal stress protein [Pelagimonas sp.]
MYEKILLAIDLNDPEGAARIAVKGAQLAQLAGGALHVVNVLPSMGMSMVGSAFGPEHTKQMVAEAHEALNTWAAGALEGHSVTTHMAQGSIYDQILKTAQTLEVDLILVGANRPELKDYLIGPNSARVTRHAAQDVLVVR